MVDKKDTALAIAIVVSWILLLAIIYQATFPVVKYNCINSDGKTLKIKNIDGCKFDTSGTWKHQSTTKDFITYTKS